MGDDRKRKAVESKGPEGKRQKSQGPKKWRVVHKDKGGSRPNAPIIEAGDSGIWISCDKGYEGKCTGELRDLFNEYSAKLYGETNSGGQEPEGRSDDDDDAEVDIEAEIQNEIKGIKDTSRTPLFQAVRTELKCVIFFKTRPPVEPAVLVHRICLDAQTGVLPFRGRYIKRLTPITLMAKATENSLKDLCETVLKPDFHAPDVEAKKFAIRPSIRNHTILNRGTVIKQVADAVGPKHSVDLENYDRCIIVEISKNLCGMAVVGADYEGLKRFNLAEIWKERKEQERGATKQGTEATEAEAEEKDV